MNGFLLDTNVISQLAPGAVGAPEHFVRWLEQRDKEGRMFLSVVTVHEIEKGIALLEHRRATAKATRLKSWLAGLIAAFHDRIIGYDVAAAARGGQLEAKAVGAGHDPGMADAMIAGIADTRDLVIISHNTRHFAPFGVAAVTPESAAGLT